MSDNSYKKWVSMSDQALIKAVGTFIQHQRLNQNKSQNKVAADAGISRSTLSLLERGESISLSNLVQVLRVLDLLHIMEVFKVENEISPIEYVKLQKKSRQRARTKTDNSKSSGDMEW